MTMAKKQTLSVSKYLAGKAKDMADIRATHKRIRDNKDKFELVFIITNPLMGSTDVGHVLCFSSKIL